MEVPYTTVKIDCTKIMDFDSFHDVFSDVMGFPDFYGRNMDAWIDCMSWVNEPEGKMTAIHSPPGGIMVIELLRVNQMIQACPDVYKALIECTAFVNYREMETGAAPRLALSYIASK